MSMFQQFVAGSMAVALATGAVMAGGGDVGVYGDGGKLHTGVYDHDDEEFKSLSEIVFGGDLAAELTSASGDEPGFGNEGTTYLLQPNAGLSFNVLPLPSAFGGTNLAYWDGTGSPAFIEATLTSLEFASQSTFDSLTITGAGTTSVTGFEFLTSDSLGEIHGHMDMNVFITGPLLPAEGVYLVSLGLQSGTLTDADPIFFVLNYGLTEEQHDLAIGEVSAVVPEPTSLALVGAGVGALLIRRRRR